MAVSLLFIPPISPQACSSSLLPKIISLRELCDLWWLLYYPPRSTWEWSFEKSTSSLCIFSVLGDEDVFWERLWGTGIFNHLFLQQIIIEYLIYSGPWWEQDEGFFMPFWSFNTNALACFLLNYPRGKFTTMNIDFLSKLTCSSSMRKSWMCQETFDPSWVKLYYKGPKLSWEWLWVMCNCLQISISRSLFLKFHTHTSICLLITSLRMLISSLSSWETCFSSSSCVPCITEHLLHLPSYPSQQLGIILEDPSLPKSFKPSLSPDYPTTFRRTKLCQVFISESTKACFNFKHFVGRRLD